MPTEPAARPDQPMAETEPAIEPATSAIGPATASGEKSEAASRVLPARTVWVKTGCLFAKAKVRPIRELSTGDGLWTARRAGAKETAACAAAAILIASAGSTEIILEEKPPVGVGTKRVTVLPVVVVAKPRCFGGSGAAPGRENILSLPKN